MFSPNLIGIGPGGGKWSTPSPAGRWCLIAAGEARIKEDSASLSGVTEGL